MITIALAFYAGVSLALLLALTILEVELPLKAKIAFGWPAIALMWTVEIIGAYLKNET